MFRNWIRGFVVAALILCLCAPLCAQTAKAIPLKNGWSVGKILAVPVAKIVESTTSGVKMDVVPVVGLCGGLSFYYTNDKTVPDHERVVSISVPAVILTARMDNADQFDATFGIVFGFMDDAIQFGVGYYMGRLTDDRSRIEGLFSLGISFN